MPSPAWKSPQVNIQCHNSHLLFLQNTRIHFQQPPFQFTIRIAFPFEPHLPCFQAGLVPQHLSHLEILPLSPLQPFRTFQVCISNSSIHHSAVFFSICYTNTLSHSTNICISPVALRNRTDMKIGWLLGVGLYNYRLICRVSLATKEDPGEVMSYSCLKMTPVPKKNGQWVWVCKHSRGRRANFCISSIYLIGWGSFAGNRMSCCTLPIDLNINIIQKTSSYSICPDFWVPHGSGET